MTPSFRLRADTASTLEEVASWDSIDAIKLSLHSVDLYPTQSLSRTIDRLGPPACSSQAHSPHWGGIRTVKWTFSLSIGGLPGDGGGQVSGLLGDTINLMWSGKGGSSISAASVSDELDGEQCILVLISKDAGKAIVANLYTRSLDASGSARVLAFKLGGREPISLLAPGGL